MSRLIHVNGNGENVIDFEPVFVRLNNDLSVIDQSLEIVCVGGYVMQLHGYRGTADIDAFFESNASIKEIIRKVGDEFEINSPDELWLNNSVSNKNPIPPPWHREEVYRFSHLTVMKVDIIYLLGMKLESGREQDLRDVAAIVKDNNDKQPLKLFSKLKEIGFNLDISVVIDAFEQVHGMEWLERFYIANESDLRDLY